MISQTSLCDQAYYLWSDKMTALLQSQQWDQLGIDNITIDNITIDNITEGIESLGKL